jgi:hypothetical protein
MEAEVADRLAREVVLERRRLAVPAVDSVGASESTSIERARLVLARRRLVVPAMDSVGASESILLDRERLLP